MKIKVLPKYDEMVFKIVGMDDTPQAAKEIDSKDLKWINKAVDDFEKAQQFLEDLYNSV